MSGSGGGSNDSWRRTLEPTPTAKPKAGQQQGGGAPPAPPDPCQIEVTTTLNSVNRTVVTTLRVGDVLDVQYDPGPPIRLLAKTPAGIAGALTPTFMPQILQCIAKGIRYQADVLSVQGGACQVKIHPR